MPIQMTREQYQAKYGVMPAIATPSTSKIQLPSVTTPKISALDTTPAITKMTRAEYNAKYGKPAVPGAESAAFPSEPLKTASPLINTPKIIPNAAKDIYSFAKDLTVGTAQRLASIPGEVSNLVKESGGIINAGKNLITTLPKSITEVATGMVPQSAKEIINTEAISKIPAEFEALAKEKGGYANALKAVAKEVPGSIPQAAKDYIEQIDRAGQAFINHPVAEGLGYLGLKAIFENPKLAYTETKKALGTTAEFVKSPVKSLTDIAQEVKPAVEAVKNVIPEVKQAIKVKADAKTIAAREKAIFDVETNYAKTRKAIDYSKDANVSSRKRIAETDVLTDAVDTDGTIRTKQTGGAVEQYKKQTIDGLEGVVRKNLENEGAKVNLAEVAKELKKQVDKSGLEGADLAAALNGIKKELEGLKIRADIFGDVPLVKIHDAKINTTGNINYQTPPETSTYRKSIARGYKNIVENNSKVNVKEINGELANYYKDIELLENLDGKKVKGGKLGKYFAQITGNVAGGAIGGVVGGFGGAAVGTVIGGEVSSAIKGRSMSKMFGKKTGTIAKKSEVLIKAKESSESVPEGVERANGLSEEGRAIEDSAYKKLYKNPKKLIDEYLAKNDNIVNTDEARKAYSDVGYKGYNAADVQEPSSTLAKAVQETLLRSSDKKRALLLSGGSGTGKTSAIKYILGEGYNKDFASVLDGNLSSLKSAIRNIEMIKKYGKIPEFVYIYRGPKQSMVEGVVKRMKFNKSEGGRLVPTKVVADNHRSSLEVIKELYDNAEKYGLSRNDFTFIDNSRGLNKAVKINRSQLEKIKYPENLKEILDREIEKLFKEDKINKIQYKKYIE